MHPQDAENLIRQNAHVYVGKVERAVLLHHDVDVLIELCMVDASPDNAESEDGCLHLEGIVRGECHDRAPQSRAVTVAETPHHAEVEPDDVAAADADVAGMRVTVEKSVLDDLFGVVLAEPPPNLRDVDPCRVESIRLVERDAVDVLHDEDVLRREIAQDARAGDEGIVAVEMCKFLDVARLDEEVHLLLGDIPHLVHQRAKVHDIVAADETDEGGSALHEHEVGTHDLVDAGALHLDDDLLA